MKLYIYPDGTVTDIPFGWKSDDYVVLNIDSSSNRSWIFDIYDHFGITDQADDVIEHIAQEFHNPFHQQRS